MSDPSNLVLGFCAKLAFRHLTPFIASLHTSGFAGDVCLVVQDVAAETIQQLRAHGIIVERAGPSAQPRMAPLASRIFSYQEFLLRDGEGYANVLLTDPASSVFQADPFAAPLPAEIVYTAERRRIGEVPAVREAVVQGYGEAVAHNMRDCTVSNADVTLGTRAGVLRYLAAMAHQLAGRTTPITGAIDRGVHNFLVHMRPLRGAWLDTTDRIAVAADTLPDHAAIADQQGIAIDDVPVPLLARWYSNPAIGAHVRASPRFRLDPALHASRPAPTIAPRPVPDATPPKPDAPKPDAVVAFYLRQRDRTWLDGFLGSLRCVNQSVAAHCIGDLQQEDLPILARHNCAGYVIPASEPTIAENVAHFYLSQVLERMASNELAQPDQVLVIDNVRALFPRDPFLAKTIGLSAFWEGPTRLADSEYNRARLGFFVAAGDQLLRNPVVSSMALRGPLELVRAFYGHLFRELVGRTELLQIHKAIQGAVNKLCYSGELGFPLMLHPNGAEVYFDFLGRELALDTRYGVRLGGTVPGIVLGNHPETPLMLKLRTDLNLVEA